MSAARESWNEERLHRWMERTLRPTRASRRFGDDAAQLRRGLQRAVLCVDQCVEGVHYTSDLAPRTVGLRAAGRSLSDLAASAAEPRALLLALCLAPSVSESWVRSLVRAVARAARDAGAELVGGDLCAARGPAIVSVTAVGEGPQRAPSRARARPGDALVSTGPLGGSELRRGRAIRPRLVAGRWLVDCGVRAMIDVSDGLARDADRLARASGVRIELENVPVHRDAKRLARGASRGDATERATELARERALYDGEDYELLAAVPSRHLAAVLAGAPRHCPELAVLGRVRAGRGVFVRALGDEREESAWEPVDPRGGWIHGS